MKKILYLTFYFEPDLCAGSFRNSPLVKELAHQARGKASVDVITTLPNRYSSFVTDAPEVESRDNYTIRRISIPQHHSGMKDQAFSFKKYYLQTIRAIKNKKYDLVVASSSRLFTAYLGYRIAKKQGIPLYLDIRDIFYDTLEDVLQNGMVKNLALPVIKSIEKSTFSYASHINLISGGFKPYFTNYKTAQYSFFPNGIDDVFIEANEKEEINVPLNDPKVIVYAGNIGEGQGLHKIIPEAAKALKGRYKFVVIGDGGAKQKLIDNLESLKVTNVELLKPAKRDSLIEMYQKADFLFVHLNNYKAFEKVLPSKFFELAAFPKPLIAGVGGFAAQFVKENIDNAILFEPCNSKQLISLLNSYEYKTINRESFIQKFKRDSINREMAGSILGYL